MSFKIQTINFNSGHKITIGVHKTPWGDCLISQIEEKLCGLIFWAGGDVSACWPRHEVIYNEEATGGWVDVAIQSLSREDRGEGKTLVVDGTPFQVSVWETLMDIKVGEVCSYQDIARKIGRPKAVRAVGNAVGKNPISLLIPCHRVLREGGGLGGYAWGVEKKRALLDYERVGNSLVAV